MISVFSDLQKLEDEYNVASQVYWYFKTGQKSSMRLFGRSLCSVYFQIPPHCVHTLQLVCLLPCHSVSVPQVAITSFGISQRLFVHCSRSVYDPLDDQPLMGELRLQLFIRDAAFSSGRLAAVSCSKATCTQSTVKRRDLDEEYFTKDHK